MSAFKAACVQLRSTDDVQENIRTASDLIRERPLASFGMAFAAGWIIAKLARSGDK